MLKDTQIRRQPGQTTWRIDNDYDPDNCGASASKLPGVCQNGDDQAWLFPVNGQIYPTIEIAEGAAQLWRIGNIAANITYNLEVVMIGKDGTEEPLPFQVISTDGVSIGRDADDEPIIRDRLLLMPSARLEVLVTHPGAKGTGARAMLRTAGFDTGLTLDEGDHWPAIDLAEVVFVDSLTGGAGDGGFAIVSDGGGAIDLTPVPAMATGNASCPRLSAGQTRIVTFDIPTFANDKKPGVDFAVPPGCMADQEYDNIGNVVIALEDDSSFEAILAAYDKAVGDTYATMFNDKPVAYRGKCFDGVLDTCVPYPAVQEWWVVNASNEAHNFHIHQTRFKVLAVRGANSAFTPIPDVYEDNYPVLAGQAIKVRIPFTRPEQIGTFVYHCHILEHEDNGMMAAIEVREIK
jgi:FtsP/CotA-like multicopper oxidase with cupredoxin domain